MLRPIYGVKLYDKHSIKNKNDDDNNNVGTIIITYVVTKQYTTANVKINLRCKTV